MVEKTLRKDRRATVTPPVDIFENEDGFVLMADLPGIGADALSLKIEEGVLSIEAEGRGDAPGFHRKVEVPRQVDAAAVKADLAGGVLTLHMPRSAAAKVTHVPIAHR